MTDAVQELLDLIDVERLELNIYRGRNRDIGSGRVYGGQVLAQALVAAQRTVGEGRVVHSMHGYFILPGDLEVPIVYFVDRLRDGRSFTTRSVTAIQHGRAIFNLSASFQIEEEGPDHQLDPPDVPAPEELQSDLEILRGMEGRIPEHIRPVMTQDRAAPSRGLTTNRSSGATE